MDHETNGSRHAQAAERTLFVFGSQVLSPTTQSITKLLRPLSTTATSPWVLDAVSGLPKYWDALTKKIPEVAGAISGEGLLADLEQWLWHGLPDDGRQVANLPNIILTPLVIISQLTQYWHYLESQGKKAGKTTTDLQKDVVAKDKDGRQGAQAETLGFCIGLLSSFAVASSGNAHEFERYAAVAVRLAMIIGALADAQESRSRGIGQGRSVAYATAWRTPTQGEEMLRIIEGLSPEAYVSVLFDEDRATVTTSKRKAPLLVKRLRVAGVTVVETGLHARVHNPNPNILPYKDALVELCRDVDGLQFPDATDLSLQTYSNAGGDNVTVRRDAGRMHEIALRAVLIQQCSWYGTFSSVVDAKDTENVSKIVLFGPEQCIPPSLTRILGHRLVNFSVLDADEKSPPTARDTAPKLKPASMMLPEYPRNSTVSSHPEPPPSANDMSAMDEDAIAVIGMSIKVAGADDINEFAQMLQTGESQHSEISPDWIQRDTLFRNTPQQKLYANLIRDIDAFDHKFFKRSPRESASMDPQQRLFLQAAYQAVEQSGYFAEASTSTSTSSISGTAHSRDKACIGVYVGSCAGDYERHTACHEPNAYSATGVMRSFVAGKVAHHFGWTGPAMVFDTACSSSAVAIHTACRAIKSGECTAALAGGISTLTNILHFQDLSAASFLSPTGQCKPFDDTADGYCRAEGIACVFLKKLSDAVADGNMVLACIAGTAVHQNQNCTPLFVPNSPSLSRLFQHVMQEAKVKPTDISLVEAHGTGTPVGDPAEYESIRMALGGPMREEVLPIGSVKGHIGHTEGASGVIALIKIITLMQGGFLPKQAGFSKISRHINVRPDDKMEIVTLQRPWTAARKIALLNNYGASGSNASMIVAQSPFGNPGVAGASSIRAGNANRFPFWITGMDARSIASYSTKLSSFLQTVQQKDTALADLSFHMSRQSNRGLSKGLIFSCRSIPELTQALNETASDDGSQAMTAKPERPVILCFGPQVSTYVGLDRKLYDSTAILRHHLGKCNKVIMSLELNSIFPDVFSQEPVRDTVKLQTMLFAMQYASAKSWMDCGLVSKVVAVVGHSFGEITALCVAGVLSLEDTVRLIAGRAKLVQDREIWGSDAGAMIVVEADGALVHDLLADENAKCHDPAVCPASIASYNGPRSYTLAGSTSAIDVAVEMLKGTAKYASIKSKRLNVTNAFHSGLVEPFMQELQQIGESLNFNDANIPVERATETRSTERLTARFVPDHMRKPVFFSHAIQRLSDEYPKAIFLEAGSNSTITVMASRAVAMNAADMHHFQAVNLSVEKGIDGLTDATVALWRQGLRVSFWGHHPLQAQEYRPLILPPYQFEKGRHWLEIKSPREAIEKAAAALVGQRSESASAGATEDIENTKATSLFTLIESHEMGVAKKKEELCFRFRINTNSEKYNKFVSGHLIAQTAPVCPATLEVDIAIEALFSLRLEWKAAGLVPVVHDLVKHVPLCFDPSREVLIEFTPAGSSDMRWNWAMISARVNDKGKSGRQVHAEASIYMREPTDPAYVQEFARFERLVSHNRCKALLNPDLMNSDDIEILQGRNIYRAFSEVVDYGEVYRGVKCVVGHREESAGRVHKQHRGDTWLDVPLSDCFGQVGGIWVNLMTDCGPDEMYIATACEMLMRSHRATVVLAGKGHGPDVWHVFARHTRQSDKEYTTDVFVFDAVTGALAEVMLGIQYARVAKASMGKMLSKLTTDASFLKMKPVVTSPSASNKIDTVTAGDLVGMNGIQSCEKDKKTPNEAPISRPDITNNVRSLLASVSGIEAGEITLDSELPDLGIDSLMGIELAREIGGMFRCEFDPGQLTDAFTVRELIAIIANTVLGVDQGGIGTGASASVHSADTVSNDESIDEIASSSGHREVVPTPASSSNGTSRISTGCDLNLSQSDILKSFGAVKLRSDELIRDAKLDNMDKVVLAATNRLCTALIVEALDQLGLYLQAAAPGDALSRVKIIPQHQRLGEFVYRFLERVARLIDINDEGGHMTRTHIAVPRKTSDAILQELLSAYPEWSATSRLTHYAGKHLAQVLSGKTDGIQVLFGAAEGRELVRALYCDHTFNRMNYGQMRDVIGGIVERARESGQSGKTLKILEMGGGIGGTTHILVPFLALLDLPVEYTFTDLAPSLVANMRRKLGGQNPFMRFAVHDIEKPPSDELKGHHIIIASNAVHATHDLVASTSNIHQALRPDGFLMMLEMTEALPFIDIVFGLLKGWSLFNDGREHAVVPPERWERDLHTAGYGHVDWTDGVLPEQAIQKVIIALASGSQHERLPKPVRESSLRHAETIQEFNIAREVEAERLLAKYTADWSNIEENGLSESKASIASTGAVIVITGATGSLGSHLVQAFAANPSVATVVCINRRVNNSDADERQDEAFTLRGIVMAPIARAKLRVVETDTSKSRLGLSESVYAWLVQHGTHIVHNAWPMSGTRPLDSFEPQFQTLRNLIDLAREMATRDTCPARVQFQLVSSIGVVGHAGEACVQERRVPLSAALPVGYCAAKWVCERMLDETLHKCPAQFRAMVVRPGQIAGSSTSGFWNPAEHFAFVVKSSQTLRAWPDLDGILQWIPVDDVAATMVDLMHLGNPTPPDAYAVYHIGNPVGQPWKAMSPVLAGALGIPDHRIIPFQDWIRLVRRAPLNVEDENPAAKLVDWLSDNFEHMACGGLILDTTRAQAHSTTLANVGPVSEQLARQFVVSWTKMGFLN
ncbi:hypothetical protein F4808DRAFT_437417 [Astrocystis sublimbata]|nr:hypothetical protein F4808DRAFT_437417 [Astrocystis sublimbata]